MILVSVPLSFELVAILSLQGPEHPSFPHDGLCHHDTLKGKAEYPVVEAMLDFLGDFLHALAFYHFFILAQLLQYMYWLLGT